MLSAFVLYAAWTGRTDFLAVMVVLALVGFVGAVTVARFVAAESEEEARILSPQEVAELKERTKALKTEIKAEAKELKKQLADAESM